MSMIVRIELGVLELEVPDSPSLAQIDLSVEEAMRNLQRRAFVSACADVERKLLEDRSCPLCGYRTVIDDVDTRRITMLSGTVSVPVRRLRCTGCGDVSAPLSARLPKGRHTTPLVERALRLATEIGYAKSSAMLCHLTGAQISHEQIRRLALEEEKHIGGELTRETTALFSHGICPDGCVTRGKDDTLVIAMDGGLVADRATKETFEARVGVVWCGCAEISHDRRMPLSRRAHVGIEGTTEFARKMSTLAIKSGMGSAGKTIVIGDGAGWIRRTARDWFPGAVYVLDLYHLKHRIGEVLGRDSCPDLHEAVIDECVAGHPHAATALLRSFDPGPDERARELHSRLIRYITVNAKGIENYTRTDLFGSGSVEKAVDVLVSRRLKCRGMSWLKPGALSILKLKMLRFNDEWDAHWESRFAQAA